MSETDPATPPMSTPGTIPIPGPAIEPITGGYITLNLGGRDCRIYFEMAGSGQPVLLLHTAGADSRQWRFILNDAQMARTYRFIAFDMPWHGRSAPPAGWQRQEYLLSGDSYIETVLALTEALQLAHPIVAGCSMGGRIALRLALHHPERFAGFIGIAASDFQPAWYDIDWFDRPDLHGGAAAAALVSTNIAPHAPDVERWNTLWMFMQSGPGVFRGDLDFYTRDDSLVGALGAIDTKKTPVHIICGAYDLTCTPEDGRRTAAQIPGATFDVIDQAGHFPMSENPAVFRPHFVAALARMGAAAPSKTQGG